MSSRFSKPANPQKPPGICRPPPPDPPYIPPPFPEQTLQTFIAFYAPHSPYEGGISGDSPLTPSNPNPKWTGHIQGTWLRVDLTMTFDPTLLRLNFALACYSNDTLWETYTLDNIEPRTWSPFHAGLYTIEPGPPDGHLRFLVLE